MKKTKTHRKPTYKTILIFISAMLLFASSCKKSSKADSFKEATIECILLSISNMLDESYYLYTDRISEDFDTVQEKQMEVIYRTLMNELKSYYCISNVVVDYPEYYSNDSLYNVIKQDLDTTIYDRVLDDYDIPKIDQKREKLEPVFRDIYREDLKKVRNTTKEEALKCIENYDEAVNAIEEAYQENKD